MPGFGVVMSGFWEVVTHLGSSSLMTPVLLVLSVGFWTAGQAHALRWWLLLLAAGVALVLMSKIAFMGWGLGIRAIDFTGISGHVFLAGSIFPVLCGWLLRAQRRPFSRAGAGLGLAIACMVAISRVVLSFHSVSEVLFGLAIGAGISYIALMKLDATGRLPRFVVAIPLILLLSMNPAASTYLPSHQLELGIALTLSGRQIPYSRKDWGLSKASAGAG